LTRYLGVGKSFVHVTHNPVGGTALDWLHGLCFREQSAAEFYDKTLVEVVNRSTRVTLDPPHIGGDPLEIEAHRAAFRDLTLATERLDLLAAVVQSMRHQHGKAVAALGVGERFQRIFLTGDRADVVRRLIPEYAAKAGQLLEEATLRGVTRLFEGSG